MMLLDHCKNSFFLGHARLNYVKASVRLRTHSTVTFTVSDLFPSLNSNSGCHKEHNRTQDQIKNVKVMLSCIYLEQS